MSLVAYTGSECPPDDKTPAIKPRLVSWTSRIWRESPERSFPMFKIEARLELRDIEDRALQEGLRPYSAQVQKLVLVPLAGETTRLATSADGRFDLDAKSANMYFHDFLGAPNGMLMLNLMQTAGSSSDIIISLVPMIVEPQRLTFAVSTYDLGIHARIS
jgi:hypothetical protein